MFQELVVSCIVFLVLFGHIEDEREGRGFPTALMEIGDV